MGFSSRNSLACFGPGICEFTELHVVVAAPIGITTLSWCGSLCVSMTPRGMSAGVLNSW